MTITQTNARNPPGSSWNTTLCFLTITFVQILNTGLACRLAQATEPLSNAVMQSNAGMPSVSATRPGLVSLPVPVSLMSRMPLMSSVSLLVPVSQESRRRLSDDVIDQVGERVMSRNEFRSVRRRVLEKNTVQDLDEGFLARSLTWVGERLQDVMKAIFDFFTWLTSGLRSSPSKAPAPSSSSSGVSNSDAPPWSFSSQLIRAMAILAIVAILVTVIALTIRSLEARKRRNERVLTDMSDLLPDVLTPPGVLAASTYEARAIRMAADGNHRAAIRELLLGSMSWIERAGLIRYRRGLTNRDYLRSVSRQSEKRNAYLTTATSFEYVYFGRRVPTAELFEQCLNSFRGAFREEETPTAAA